MAQSASGDLYRELDSIPSKYAGLAPGPQNIGGVITDLTILANKYLAPEYVEHEDTIIASGETILFPEGYNYTRYEWIVRSAPFVAYGALDRHHHVMSNTRCDQMIDDDKSLYRIGGATHYSYHIAEVPVLGVTDRLGYSNGERYQVWRFGCDNPTIENLHNCPIEDLTLAAIRTDTGNRDFVDIQPEYITYRPRNTRYMNEWTLNLDSNEYTPLEPTNGFPSSKRTTQPTPELPVIILPNGEAIPYFPGWIPGLDIL